MCVFAQVRGGGRAEDRRGHRCVHVCVCVCGKYQCHYKGRVSLQLLIVMETYVGVSVGRGVLMCVCVCVFLGGFRSSEVGRDTRGRWDFPPVLTDRAPLGWIELISSCRFTF